MKALLWKSTISGRLDPASDLAVVAREGRVFAAYNLDWEEHRDRFLAEFPER